MRKLLFSITLVVSLFTFALPVFAAPQQELSPAESDRFRSGARMDGILPIQAIADTKNGQSAKLPTADFKTGIVPAAIKVLLGFMGTIAFGIFTYAGVMLVISQGNEDELKHFKEMLLWSVVGMVLITTSYGIVRGILQLVLK